MRLLLLAFALAGVIGVFPILQKQFLGTEICPALGPLPACYLVFSGYTLIVASAFVGTRYRFRTFTTGWVPLFVLAATGSGLELLGKDACPRTSSGVPTCFLSLGLLGVLAMIYMAERRYISRRLERDPGT